MAATEDQRLDIATTGDIALPVAASATIFLGEMVGYAAGVANSLTRGQQFRGHAVSQANNSSGSAADIDVEIKNGRYVLQVNLNASNITTFMVGAWVYAVDDNTYTLAPTGTVVGRIVQRVDANTAFVEFDTNLARASMVGGHFDSFHRLAIDQWTKTEVGTNTESIVVDAAHGLRLITGATEDNGPSLQLLGETIQLNDNVPVIMGGRFKINDVTQSDIILGLAITDTALQTVTDGVYFRSVDATTDLDFVIEKDSAETVLVQSSVLVDDTFVDFAFVYDGNTTGSTITPYINGAPLAVQVDTNRPDDEEVTLSIEILTGEAVAQTMIVPFMDAYEIRGDI